MTGNTQHGSDAGDDAARARGHDEDPRPDSGKARASSGFGADRKKPGQAWDDADFARLSGLISGAPAWRSTAMKGEPAAPADHRAGPSFATASKGHLPLRGHRVQRLWIPLVLSTGGILVVGQIFLPPARIASLLDASSASQMTSTDAPPTPHHPAPPVQTPRPTATAIIGASPEPVVQTAAMTAIVPLEAPAPIVTKAAMSMPTRRQVDEVGDGATAVGDLVVDIQARLIRLNYAPGPVNGRLNLATQKAIMEFQADEGLPPTGGIDATLLARLKNATQLDAGRQNHPAPLTP
jgi:hypothetical protein